MIATELETDHLLSATIILIEFFNRLLLYLLFTLRRNVLCGSIGGNIKLNDTSMRESY